VVGPKAVNPCDLVMVFPQNIGQGNQSFLYNLGAGYVLAYLKQKGVSGVQFVPQGYLSVAEAAERIVALHPRVVGFTVYFTNFDTSSLVARAVKTRSPETIIVFGGPTPTTMDEDVLRLAPAVDVCVRGDGEETMLGLMESLTELGSGRDRSLLEEIEGITFRRRTALVRTPDRARVPGARGLRDPLDAYPSPHLEHLIPSEAALGRNGTGIITARGCNQHCTYCNCAILSGRRVYTHSLDRLIDEIGYISGTRSDDRILVVQDDAFTLLRSRARRLCEQLLKQKVRARLSCITRCDLVDAELLDLMHAAGFVSIGFALESATPRVLRAIGKTGPAEDDPTDSLERERSFIERFKWAVSYCRKRGFGSVFASIMVGLPHETPREAQETVRVVEKLDLDFYMHNPLIIFPGTPIHAHHARYGYRVACSPGSMTTHHPFNVLREVPLGRKADRLAGSIRDNHLVSIALSLSPFRNGTSRGFEGLIFVRDVLRREDVDWLKDVLVIDGLVVQIYSCRDAAETWRRQNTDLIKTTLKPTKRWFSYVPDRSEFGREVLRLLRDFTTVVDVDRALSLSFVPTSKMDADPREYGVASPSLMVCVDRTREDGLALHRFLSELTGSESRSPTPTAFRRGPMPRFSTLCRWTRDAGNCRSMRWAIVDASNGVRLCWSALPLGSVGESFARLRARHRSRTARLRARRRCSTCPVRESCITCAATSPFPGDEYCRIRRKSPIQGSADFFSALLALNDTAFGGGV